MSVCKINGRKMCMLLGSVAPKTWYLLLEMGHGFGSKDSYRCRVSDPLVFIPAY